MTDEDIIRMAQQSGLLRAGDGWTEPARWGLTEIERFAALVTAAEREACASICDRFQARDVGMQPAECAGAIRALCTPQPADGAAVQS